jgi:hypothetical protein
LTWWKLAIIAGACGLASIACGLLIGVSPVLVWLSGIVCALMALGFLVVEMRFNQSRPTFGLGENSPKTNRWRNRAAVLPLIVVVVSMVGQVALKAWPDGEPAGPGTPSINIFPPGDGPERCERQEPYGLPN